MTHHRAFKLLCCLIIFCFRLVYGFAPSEWTEKYLKVVGETISEYLSQVNAHQSDDELDILIKSTIADIKTVLTISDINPYYTPRPLPELVEVSTIDIAPAVKAEIRKAVDAEYKLYKENTKITLHYYTTTRRVEVRISGYFKRVSKTRIRIGNRYLDISSMPERIAVQIDPELNKRFKQEEVMKRLAKVKKQKLTAQNEENKRKYEEECKRVLKSNLDNGWIWLNGSFICIQHVVKAYIGEEAKQDRLAEARRIEAEERRIAEEKRRKEAEERRIAAEQRRKEAEERRRAEEQRLAEEKRLAEERRRAEEQRLAEERARRLREEQENAMLAYKARQKAGKNGDIEFETYIITPSNEDKVPFWYAKLYVYNSSWVEKEEKLPRIKDNMSTGDEMILSYMKFDLQKISKSLIKQDRPALFYDTGRLRGRNEAIRSIPSGKYGLFVQGIYNNKTYYWFKTIEVNKGQVTKITLNSDDIYFFDVSQ